MTEFTRFLKTGTEKIESIKFPEIEIVPMNYNVKGGNVSPLKKQAVVNTQTGQAYSFTGKNYNLIKHEQAIEHVLSAIPKSWGKQKNSAWLSPDGGRLSVRIQFPKASEGIQAGDLVCPSIYLVNSYDKSWPFMVTFGAFRFVCSNGMVVGKKFGEYHRKHVGEFSQENLREMLDNSIEMFQDEVGRWRIWNEKPAMPEHYENWVEALQLGKRAVETIENIVETKSGLRLDNMKIRTLSLWELFNIFTQFITHNVSENQRVMLENRLKAVL